MPRLSSAKEWLREPLLHFLAAGLLLFAGYRALHPEPEQPDHSRRIALTEDDLRQLEVAWVAQWQRPPTPEERRGLLETKVREEILYREALALGLEQGDIIVKRRLAQKMEFLAEDVSVLREPKIEEIRTWFERHSERFTIPGRISFHHLYFSFDTRGAETRDVAVRALARLAGQPADSLALQTLADPFMFQDHYADRSSEQLAGIFGPKFAQALFRVKPGSWQGPIESGYGWHLVWIDSITPSRVPAFEEIEPDVKSEWIADQRAEAKRKTFEAMRSRYEVALPEASAVKAAP